MKTSSNHGGGMISALFALLFIVSVALNAILLVGCDTLTGGQGPSFGKPQGSNPSRTTPSAEATHLRDIAAALGLSETSEKTPGDIAFDISRRLERTLTYRGPVLSEESFSDCKDAILDAGDRASFEDYHTFVRKIAGKKLVILD